LNKIITVSLVVICAALIVGAVIYGASTFQKTSSSSTLTSTPTPSTPTPSLTPNEISAPTLTKAPSSPPPGAIVVPDSYSTIKQAVRHSSDGDTVFVRKGQYNETVTVEKSLWLVGEDRQTIIDAHSIGPDLLILHDNVNVTGFTMINSPTPATGTWLENMMGIGLPTQLSDIQIIGASHCNIYGNNLANSLSGVSVENASQNNIIGNEISENSRGVRIEYSANNYVANNVIKGGGSGIAIVSSANNSIISNIVTGAGSAIWLNSASANTLRNNTLIDNYGNFRVQGNEKSAFINYVDTSNTIDGKPIYYWIGRSNEIVPSDAACIILVDCFNITAKETDLALSSHGIVLAYTNNSIIKSNKLASLNTTASEGLGRSGSALDIMLFSSFNNDLTNNLANIWLYSSFNNRITQNTGVIRLYDSKSNEISDNKITSISFVPVDWSGLVLSNSSNNQILRNSIKGNSAGIQLINSADNNRIINNTIEDNGQGGIIVRSRYNLVLGNEVTGNGNFGIQDSGFGTSIIGNSVIKNWGMGGLLLDGSFDCTITGNVIEGSSSLGGSNTRVVGNNITIYSVYSQSRVWFRSIHPGIFYHNNFLSPITIQEGANHIWDNGREGNYWSNYNGTDANGDGIGDTPYVIDDNYQDRYPLMAPFDIDSVPVELPEWATPPSVHLINPENTIYASTNVTLEFTVNKQTSWVGYSLDEQDNVTVTGNITITGLSRGLHNVTVYAKDSFENMGASETITFSVAEEPEPFPTALVATASGAAAIIIGIGLLVYFRKRKH